jgi:heme-degrading monooxygenase HmoA
VAKAGDYVRHASETVFPQIQSIPGHRGAYLLRRSVGNGIEFLVLTLWASMDAVRRFAGPEPEKAVVEPAARAALSDFEETVTHYEVVARTEEGG